MADDTSQDKLKQGKDVDDFETDLDANASAFEALERDFQDVCSMLLNYSLFIV